MMKAAGYTCPFCSANEVEFDILKMVSNDDGFVVGLDLRCPRCAYEWHEARE